MKRRIGSTSLRDLFLITKTIGYVISAIFRFIGWLISNKRTNADGYIVRKSEAGHDELEHRAIAENILGRRLSRWEIVHHINGKTSDNRVSNLCVMDGIEHDRYHKWYDWIYKTYGRYPRRETQLKKLKENFKGILLIDVKSKEPGTG
jgi:HNH endonuclease